MPQIFYEYLITVSVKSTVIEMFFFVLLVVLTNKISVLNCVKLIVVFQINNLHAVTALAAKNMLWFHEGVENVERNGGKINTN